MLVGFVLTQYVVVLTQYVAVLTQYVAVLTQYVIDFSIVYLHTCLLLFHLRYVAVVTIIITATWRTLFGIMSVSQSCAHVLMLF